MSAIPILFALAFPVQGSSAAETLALLRAAESISFQPAVLGLHSAPARPRCARSWRGERDGFELRLDLRVLARSPGRLEEPELVPELLRTTRRRPLFGGCSRMPRESFASELIDEHEIQVSSPDPPRRASARLGRTKIWNGPLGAVSRAGRASGPTYLPERAEAAGWRLVVGGLLLHHAWVLELDVSPAPPPGFTDELELLLRGEIEVRCPPRRTSWTDGELLERWNAVREGKGEPHPQIQRTAHFAVVGDAFFGPPLLRAIEKRYAIVRDELPFEERPGQRRLPIFLFRRASEFRSSVGWNGLNGLAWNDACATWYREPGDAVLAHEIVHQLVRNRLFLIGGTKWLQEGLAESLSRPAHELRDVARALARGASPPSWLDGSGSWSLGGRFFTPRGEFHPYAPAAVAIDFLRRDRSTAGSFRRFLELASDSGPLTARRCEEAAHEAFGASLEELRIRWIQQWTKAPPRDRWRPAGRSLHTGRP